MTALKSERPPGPYATACRDGIRMWRSTCFLRLSRVFCGPARVAMGLLLLAAITLGVRLDLVHAQTTATYDVTFTGNWTTSSTTVAVPRSAHFTTLIGAVHNSDVTFWESGGTATAGVELVAEIGGTSMFRTEIGNAEGGTVKSTVSESGVGATGEREFELEFSRTHPLLTLLSMIGPSPDWFVGVSGLSLLDSSDAWRSSHTVDLFAYDAGTEDGENFRLGNPDTNPRGTITSLRNMGKFTSTRMARLSFTLKTPPQNRNNAPEFSGMSATRSFTETVGDATVRSAGDIGAAVAAIDDDNDTLSYTLEGTDKDSFTIDSGTGQIKTKVGSKYDREAKGSYSVTVKADDQNGGTDMIAVTINVTNVEEKPLAPAAPLVSSGSTTSVNVMWTAPGNAGRPAIQHYDLQYRQGTGGSWTDGPQDVTGPGSMIMNLMEGTGYQARVRATNSDGDGPWSQPGTGQTNMRGNRMPSFTGMNATRSFTETVGDATARSAGDVGTPVSATDQDNNTLVYSLGGADAVKFIMVSTSGQIQTKVGESYDRETKESYSVIVMADDQNGGTDTIMVTINVMNAEEKPLKPAQPAVSSGSTTSVNVMWTAPGNAGRPAIQHYDLQYRQGTGGSWTDGPQDVTGTGSMIMNLMEGTEYQARVRASNSDGDSPWSDPGTGRTDVQSNRVPALPPPSTEAAQVDTDGELREFVEDAAARIETSDTFGETLRLLEEFRDREGYWNDGSMYLILLTRRGGVYFHANKREVEDLDWSGVLFCDDEGRRNVLDIQGGCFIEYDDERSGYAHLFSASHVPLAHGEDEFILLGGFDETPEGKAFPLTGALDEPSTAAGDVDTDGELREFVRHAGRALMGAIVNSEIDPAELRGILRREGPWREGDVHIWIMDERGRVIFDGEDRSREQKNEYAKQYVRDLIAEADEGIVEYREDGLLIRGYAARVEAPLDEDDDEASRVYVVGSGYRVEELSGGSDSGGGGCAVGASGSDGTFGLSMAAALGLLFAVSLRSGAVLSGVGRYPGSATKLSGLPEPDK
ncbi:MAG: spondin domain-containing protein [Candidatus Dadabacteria bacterium]|nr:spondin domain-containing protein [Candidatus Dadabacteria bacterium]